MTIYECDRCHEQFKEKTAIHRVDIRLYDWKQKKTSGGEGEICDSCIDELTTLFNVFMKGVNPYGKTDT